MAGLRTKGVEIGDLGTSTSFTGAFEVICKVVCGHPVQLYVSASVYNRKWLLVHKHRWNFHSGPMVEHTWWSTFDLVVYNMGTGSEIIDGTDGRRKVNFDSWALLTQSNLISTSRNWKEPQIMCCSCIQFALNRQFIKSRYSRYSMSKLCFPK